MIDRYTRQAMGSLWTDQSRFESWLRVEVLACEAWAQLGVVPQWALADIQERAGFDLARILELESELHHDVLAFTTAVAERVGEAGRYFHYGLTSSDVVDTALSAQLRQAGQLLLDGVDAVLEHLDQLAWEHRGTVMVGRTHGVHAEPMTFGLKLAGWLEELRRGRLRLERARHSISVGKLSGAVGTYAHLDPFVEQYVCQHLGLAPDPISTQVVQRDRHAEFVSAIALVGASLERFAVEMRHLQRTEVGEAFEPFGRGQKGSSAMPHKRNPIIAERISGLARVLRGNAQASLENVALWHERDISHSSVERVILPDSTILLDYMLHLFLKLIVGIEVDPDRMRANLDSSGGLVFSGAVLLALAAGGMSREEAYGLVQSAAMHSWRSGTGLQELLVQQPRVVEVLGPEGLAHCFDLDRNLSRVPIIFDRLGIGQGQSREGGG